MKILGLLGLCILLIGCDRCPSIDVKPLPIVYCEHMGYEIIIEEETNRPKCLFYDYTSCYTDDFYDRTCGNVSRRELSVLRSECQDVYVELGERCEKGLVMSKPEYLLDQPHCRKPNIFTIV